VRRSLLALLVVGVAASSSMSAAASPGTPDSQGKDLARAAIANWRDDLARGVRNDTATRFPNPPTATFRARLRAAAARYGFRVVKVEMLEPLQAAPLVIVQPTSQAALAASTRAILHRLDPPARVTGGRLASQYEGILFEAQDSHGNPYEVVSRAWRLGESIRVWTGAGGFAPVPSAFPIP
jgi:hypothetical protein